MELCSLIRQYLHWLATLVDAILQQMDGMFACWGVMDLAAWNESTMIVQVTDHPFVAFCELEVSLPEAVTMLPLDPTLTPNPPRRLDWIVQSSLDEYSMDSVVTNRDYAFTAVVLELAFDLAWAPTLLPLKLEYEIRNLLRCLPETVTHSGLEA
jgi:hypothetical protein